MFDWKKPTVQMLGRWQPWHKGHRELFKRCISKTGQVIIQVRDIKGSSGGPKQNDNPFEYKEISTEIEEDLSKEGYKRGKDYEIMLVPNIVNITYGRGVGYVFEEEKFTKEISEISATKIRKELRESGELE
ncbi:MAG: cytidyltransferase [Candidatus Marinimicrobia bacterium]|mgnify:FL=1|nr:cytidyltransferase [Candidatus Neomarinimicrobiota bacterium]|tara:strand:+ start:1767 stop:2159 length:393 start_codon:yes stop_codon:yes gene_type:complete